MKTKIFLWIAFTFYVTSIIAQEPTFTKSFSINSQVKKLKVDLQYGDLHVVIGESDQVKVETYVDINGGELSEAYEFEASIKGSNVEITGELDMSIFKNKSVNHSNKWGSWKNTNSDTKDEREVIISGKKYSYEKSPYNEYDEIKIDIMVAVFLPKSMEIEATTLYGSSLVENLNSNIKIDATYGSVDIKCADNINANSIDVESIYSTVDLAVPASLRADLKMKSGYGKIYTDLNISPEFQQKKQECWIGDDITATMNGGGISVNIESGYSNLYLRKL